MTNEWTWAKLSGDELTMLSEAERTLGTEYLLAYQQDGQPAASSTRLLRRDLRVAPLNESQVECLQGLEAKLQAVVVAYQLANP